MKILVVGGHSTDKDSTDQMAQYRELFTVDKARSNTNYCFLDELVFTVSPNAFEVSDTRNGLSVKNYDLVVFRGKIRAYSRIAYCLSLFLEENNMKSLNNYLLYRSPSKLAQAITMYQLGLNFPKTISCDQPEHFLSAIKEELTLPIILKDTHGSHGKLNFLVNSHSEIQNILKKHSGVSFIAQESIPNDGSDYRILIAGEDKLAIKRQANNESHLTNTSQGGEASLLKADELPESVLKQARAFAKRLNMDIAGVDVIKNTVTDQFVFLEINSQPQLVTGAFPAEKKQIIQDLLSSISGPEA